MKRFLYGIVGFLISFIVFISFLTDIPESLTAKYDLREFDNYKNKANMSDKDMNLSNRFFKKIYDSYHIYDTDLRYFKENNILVYKKINPMYFWIKKITSGEEKIALTIDNMYDYSVPKGYAIGYNTENGDLLVVDVVYIENAIKDGGELPIAKDLYKITSKFGLRQDPFNKNNMVFHKGLDIAGKGIEGREVTPVLFGTVIKKETDNTHGNYVVIDHKEFKTTYAHLEGFGRINIGDEVTTDKVIGYVGNTGKSTGPHLHLEFEADGIKINPEHFMDLLRRGNIEYEDNIDNEYEYNDDDDEDGFYIDEAEDDNNE